MGSALGCGLQPALGSRANDIQPIHSRTTTQQLLRAGLVDPLIGGFAAAFLYDGHGGYARKNALALLRSLGLPEAPPPPIDPRGVGVAAGVVLRRLQEGA